VNKAGKWSSEMAKKNNDRFGEKLGEMIINLRQEAYSGFKSEIKEIVGIIAEAISNDEEYKRNDKYLNALEQCEEYAKTCDAMENLNKYIFERFAKDGIYLKDSVSINTINRFWEKGYENYGDFFNKIEETFQKKGFNPNKGFVYIFWSENPLKYFYVGETKKGVKRPKDSNHTKAILSSLEATKLTIIYPYPKPKYEKAIDEVEASIIRIIRPILNVKKGRISEDNSLLSESLSEFKEILEILAEYLNKYKILRI
jgi:hypothetical protein